VALEVMEAVVEGLVPLAEAAALLFKALPETVV
jgi:hypothetical protein